MNLDTKVINLTRVGKSVSAQLGRLGIETVRDLIFYYPFRYEDYSKIVPVAELVPGAAVTIKGKIELIKNKRSSRQRKFLTEALVSDDSASIKIVWFNQGYIAKQLKPGTEVYFSGEPRLYGRELFLNNPAYEIASDNGQIHTAGIVPVYHLTEKLTQKQLRFLTKTALAAVSQIMDWLPSDIRKKYKLMDLIQALEQIHFPEDNQNLEEARRRLKFNELFLLQLFAAKVKVFFKKSKAHKIIFDKEITNKFIKSLPFELTTAQKRAAWEIFRDLEEGSPMNRLLEGDVGSGKTVVAAIPMINVWKAGFQSALMAATEILAEQHFKTLKQFLEPLGIRIALLTRNNSKLDDEDLSKKDLLDKIEKREIDVLIGTHAVIQESVKFKNLALSIIDEQHRFGVEQRKALRGKTDKILPHLLSMTATPIPRSLTLAIYGDLDISAIREMPKGRKKVLTKIVDPRNRNKAYDFIREKVKSGRQVFVICPLIEPSDKLGVKSVEEEFKKLDKNIFPELKIAALHGKLKSEERGKIMEDFRNNKINILISTSVVEVGVDIPNATIMMIEGADRFGLAQLHQFRGRVGRGEHQSFCFLFTDNNSQKTKERLEALVSSDNGFKLAEKDLELRGPGEIYGTRQSGDFELKIATIFDYEIMKQAKEAAKNIIDSDPDLDNFPLLKNQLELAKNQAHLE